MARDLQTCSEAALPAVNVAEPATLLFLPPWLDTQLAMVSDLGAGRTIIDTATGRITGRVATIPRSKMPSGARRAAIEQRITELHVALRPGPTGKMIAAIAELIAEHAPSRLDEDTADIKIGAYRDAVDDLPAWAVREALRRWRRGDVPGVTPHDLEFAPKPPRLRRIALGIADVAKGQALRLQRILDAEPLEELSESERQANQERLAGTMKAIADGTKAIPTEPTGSDTADRRAALAQLETWKRVAMDPIPHPVPETNEEAA